MPSFDEAAARLRVETSGLVKTFKERAKRVRGSVELLSLTRRLNRPLSTRTALELFGEGEHKAIGVDGSMATDQLLEMIVFYTNACAFGCPFVVTRDGPNFLLDSAEREVQLDISCTVPLWTEDMPSVTGSGNLDTDFDINAVSDKLPFAVMTMGELVIANRVMEADAAKVVFMDRPLSGTYGPLARDYRELLMRSRVPLGEPPTPHGNLTKLDLAMAYDLHDGSLHIPPRRRFLRARVLKRLLEGDKISYNSLAKEIGLGESGADNIRRMLRRLCDDGDLLEAGKGETDPHVKISEVAKSYWKRVSFVLETVPARVFEGKEHPLRLKEGWINAFELNSLNLLLLRGMLVKSLSKKILVIGIAKDTLATEFGRTIIPYTGMSPPIPAERSQWSMKSDKSLLNLFSTSDEFDVPTPWRTIGYDSAFGSLVVTDDKGPRLAAARRRMSVEGRFVRSYFELRSFSSDPKSKSSVFLYDRFQWPEFDKGMIREERVREERSVEKASLYFEGEGTNQLDNLVLGILGCSDNPNVIEAFGHNHLLFLADKAVKADARTARSMLKGIVWLELGPLVRSDRMFNNAMSFRDIRAESEERRKRAAWE